MSNQLFFLSLADIFSIYPAIFKDVVQMVKKPKHIYLPSDIEWQDKMYFMLLEVQRQVNEAMDRGVTMQDINKKEKPIFDANRITKVFTPSPSPSGRRSNPRKLCHPTTVKVKLKTASRWSLQIITKAAKLLKKPPMHVEFMNEHEMRLVYSLIYDVFRYKVVMANALNDIGFYEKHAEYKGAETCIWLMLFELYDRHFKNRNAEEADLQLELYKDAKVDVIADLLWRYRVRLAASISRMRIRFGALRLSKLLPIHLQNEKVAIAAANPTVTGWINPFLIKDKAAADKLLTDMGFTVHGADEEKPLAEQHCKWDNICPLFLSLIPKDRSEFTKSKLMTKHYFIMQDKNFSYGPAIMSKLLDYFELDGDILQTHIGSPRSTAYLAALFYSVNRVNNFYVYGAGSSLKEYRNYMESIGVNNIRIFGESFTSFPMESNRFRTIVGIFATPPNSFSAISDPIDLICSRGGDLSMLEVLTESEVSDEGRHRVALILEEQLLTLTMSMSRPQIQFVLYQTHSIVDTENQDMIKHVIETTNRLSLEKHRNAYKEQKRLEALAEAEAANIPAAAMNKDSPRKSKAALSAEDKRKSQADLSEKGKSAGQETSFQDMPPVQRVDSIDRIVVPEIDEFVLELIPDICINQDNCIKTQTTGCYMALAKRRSITQLNEKYLILMAERRGLFGRERDKSARSKQVKVQETQEHANAANDGRYGYEREHGPHANAESVLLRLLQPTNASAIRSNLTKISYTQTQPITFNFRRRECKRYVLPLYMQSITQRSQLWWQYAYRCITSTTRGTVRDEPGNTNIWHPNLKFKIYCNRKLRSIKRMRNQRQVLHLHISTLELNCQLYIGRNAIPAKKLKS